MAGTVLTGGVPAVPEFRRVAKDVFDRRAKRLADLSRGHAMGEYLRFAAALAAAQATEFGTSAGIPDQAELERSRNNGLPTLAIASRSLAGWQVCLQRWLDAIDIQAMPARTRQVVGDLRNADAALLEAEALKVVNGAYSELDPGRMPFIGAALQLDWTSAAYKLGEEGRSPGVDSRQCPVCGSPPVAGIIRSSGSQQGLRYLVCSLCSSEWHLVRIKCSGCAATGNISYLYVDGANDAVRAECCDDCRTYLKLLYLEKDQHMEALADDLATLALDVLVDEQGYRRLAPNLLLAPGS